MFMTHNAESDRGLCNVPSPHRLPPGLPGPPYDGCVFVKDHETEEHYDGMHWYPAPPAEPDCACLHYMGQQIVTCSAHQTRNTTPDSPKGASDA